MEEIVFDTGVKRYKCGGDVLTFNPKDPNFCDRFYDLKYSLERIENDIDYFDKELKEEEIDEEEKTKRLFDKMVEIDKEIKQKLNETFGNGNDFEKIFDGVNCLAINTNGNRVIVEFINALIPIIENTIQKDNEEIIKRVGNREQRRARNK